MKSLHDLRWLVFGFVITAAWAAAPTNSPQKEESFMLRLTRAFDAAWDRGDIPAMEAMLDPECVFRSPFQVRLGREAIRDNVFKNWKRFRDTHSIETQAKVENDIAYSFQESTFTDYGPEGGSVAKARRVVKHLLIFTRRPGQDWKIRALFTFEEMPFSPDLPVGK